MVSSPGTRYSSAEEYQVIGWREWLTLPNLNVVQIKAKIDSGARTSVIHAYNVRKFWDGGAPCVSFSVHPAQRSSIPSVDCVAEVRDERPIRSSSGHQECRIVIETEVRMGGKSWPIELALADRDQMGFRMLLGRESIRGKFLIDPHRSFLVGRSYADVTNLALRNERPK